MPMSCNPLIRSKARPSWIFDCNVWLICSVLISQSATASWIDGTSLISEAKPIETQGDMIEFSGEDGVSEGDYGTLESNSAMLEVVENRWSEQGDLRTVGHQFVSAHFGESTAYSIGALRYGLFLNEQWMISAGFGMGQMRLSDKNDIATSKIRSSAASVRSQWWWSPQTPLSVFAELGYVSSRLEANCKTNVTNSDETSKICKDSRGAGRGVSFASGIDLHWSFRSEVYWGIAWTIVGVRRSLYQKTAFEGGVLDETKPNIEKYLKGPMFFGLNNIGVFVAF